MAGKNEEPTIRIYYRSVSAVLHEARCALHANDFAGLMKILNEEYAQKDPGCIVRKRLLDVVNGDFTPTPDQMQAMVILLTNPEMRR